MKKFPRFQKGKKKKLLSWLTLLSLSFSLAGVIKMVEIIAAEGINGHPLTAERRRSQEHWIPGNEGAAWVMGSRSAGLINLEGSGGHRRLVSPQETSQILRLPAGWPLARSLSPKFFSFFFPSAARPSPEAPFHSSLSRKCSDAQLLAHLFGQKKWMNNNDSWRQWNKTTVNYWDNQTARAFYNIVHFQWPYNPFFHTQRRKKKKIPRPRRDTDHVHWDGVHHSILDANVSGLGITRINSSTFVPGTTCFWSSQRLVMRFHNPGRHQIKTNPLFLWG